MSMSVYLRARSALDLVSNQGCSSCHVCSKKIPLHYSFVTQCVEVFFLSVKFRHNSVCVGVRWHGLKKNEIKQVPILCIYSLLFLLFGLNGIECSIFQKQNFSFVSRFIGQFCHQETTHLNKEVILFD